MNRTVVIFVGIVVFSGCLLALAGEPVGEGGSYVPKQEGVQQGQKETGTSFKNYIENIYRQQGNQLSMQLGQQGLDAAMIANGTWQLQGQVQTVAGVMPYNAVETWQWDPKQGILYINGWIWKGRSAGNYIQVQTQIETGAQTMLTIQFLSNNEAICNMNVGATQQYSPCIGQYRAVRRQ